MGVHMPDFTLCVNKYKCQHTFAGAVMLLWILLSFGFITDSIFI